MNRLPNFANPALPVFPSATGMPAATNIRTNAGVDPQAGAAAARRYPAIDESAIGPIRTRSPRAASADFAGDLRVDAVPRAGERTAELVGEFMSLFECHLGPKAVGDLSDIKKTQTGRMKLEQPHVGWDAIVRNINAYCRGLASSVGEFIRSDPSLEPQARAVGNSLALAARPLLAAGIFVPPPAFYRIADETRASGLRADAARRKYEEKQAADQAEIRAEQAARAALGARWTAGMDTFYARNVRGVLEKRVVMDMQSLGVYGIVVVEGDDSLQMALDYLPPGIEMQQFGLLRPGISNTISTMRYPGLAVEYKVVIDGVWKNLAIRTAAEGRCDYRLDDGEWIAGGRSLTPAQRGNQTRRLDREINRVRPPPIDF